MLLDWLRVNHPDVYDQWTKIMGKADPRRLISVDDLANYFDNQNGDVSVGDIQLIIEETQWFVNRNGDLYIDWDTILKVQEDGSFDTFYPDDVDTDYIVDIGEVAPVSLIAQLYRDWSFTNGFTLAGGADGKNLFVDITAKPAVKKQTTK